ncbi:MAG: DUF4199 domain-containing protein [Chitinophagaceae bacterium]|nr:DUF4199 domain-containing protein [Chitinophagaceae bacterium]
MTRELQYGMIAGFITLGWMSLGYFLHWESTVMGIYAPYLSLFILAAAIYITILQKRDREKGGLITFKDATTAGMVVSFVVGLMVGAYLFVYVKYVNTDYLNQMITTATDYYKTEKASQEQIDKGIAGVKAMYSPFGQFTYGIGSTMMTGLLITLVMSFIMQRNQKKPELRN